MNGSPADSLRAVLDSVFAGSAYRWVEPPHPFSFLGRWWDALQRWLSDFQEGNPQLFEVFFWGLILVLLLVFVHASYVMLRTVRTAASTGDKAEPAPVAERRDAVWHRRRAEELAAAGRFVEAMPFDFLGLMLELDGRKILRYQPSKTPGEYAREAQLPEQQRGLLRDVVGGLYGHVFAARPCGLDDYLAWRALTDSSRYAAAH